MNKFFDRYFYQPVAPHCLNLFRFLFCFFLACQFFSFGFQRPQGIFYPIFLFELFHVDLMSKVSFAVSAFVLIAALLFSAIGLFTRVSLILASIFFLYHMGTIQGFSNFQFSSYVSHSTNIIFFILIILSVSPGVSVWGLDGLRRRKGQRLPSNQNDMAIPNWPVQLIKLTLTLAYFGAGYCKLLEGGIYWADGYTFQAYLLKYAMFYEIDITYWLAQQYEVCVLLSIFILVFEITFPIIIFIPRLTWIYVIGGLMFHGMSLWTMRINYFPYFGYVYFIFIDLAQRQTIVQPPSDLNSYKKHFSKLFMIGFITFLLGCIFLRIEFWPFTDYRLFQHRRHYRKMKVYRLAGVTHQGATQWLEPKYLHVTKPKFDSRMKDFIRHIKDKRKVDAMIEQLINNENNKFCQEYSRATLIKRSIRKFSNNRFEFLDKSLRDINICQNT